MKRECDNQNLVAMVSSTVSAAASVSVSLSSSTEISTSYYNMERPSHFSLNSISSLL